MADGFVRTTLCSTPGHERPTFTGAEVALNNPDAIQEVSIITNQFKAEYGHNAGVDRKCRG